MNYECVDCHKTFLHAAVLTGSLVMGSEKDASREHTLADPILERRVCPFCLSLNIQEHVEQVLDEKIVSVKSVDLDKVDTMIAEGYEVKELYAKAATMVKKAVVKEASPA